MSCQHEAHPKIGISRLNDQFVVKACRICSCLFFEADPLPAKEKPKTETEETKKDNKQPRSR